MSMRSGGAFKEGSCAIVRKFYRHSMRHLRAMTGGRWAHSSVLASVLGALGAACLPAAHAAVELDDAAARIQYAFYTADTRGLADVLALIGEMDGATAAPAMKEYYLAYGNWKLAQVYGDEAIANR